ncbi:beta-ketoacyl-ACP synthase 3 [Lentzea sp. NBRC 102530]|uniref:3-oxoacyl-ACP synthase III family protein n=1 Tax=Lentzea sp. NBRC 102530 TaxID=3032201 RepID=UPI0024A22B32|nr:beta-ketoacyl-ACP synthase 3 [Lentzea sp. NBRC 102530]GLY46847.1 3-oxoacyl-[acyl-carrier-protein] synthase 3 protein 1 [Lentzea sp. NBRC 102530]
MRLKTRPRRHSAVLGMGSYRPRTTVSNEEIGATLRLGARWIESRSGIASRRFAAPDETVLSMAVAAGRRALDRAGVPADRVSRVIVATCSNQVRVPAVANAVARDLGVVNASGFDVNAACAGFCYALALASDAVSVGEADHVLVIGVERMRDIVDEHDKGTSFLFADGAGAAVVGPSAEPGIGPSVSGSDIDSVEAVRMSSLWGDYEEAPREGGATLRMNGMRVFRWAMADVLDGARLALTEAGVGVGDLAAFVPHQANERMLDILVAELGLPPSTVVARDIRETGNTSAASVPLALCRLVEEGTVRTGDPVLLLGFGAGLTYCGQVVLAP